MPREPRARCTACAFAWYSATSADGLRIVGGCPRCGGALEFFRTADEDAADAARVDRLADQHPATVLGTPLGWDR